MNIRNLSRVVPLAVTLILWQGAAHAQEVTGAPVHGIGGVLGNSSSFVTMVCHESGGSGFPLTDYVNNIDVSLYSKGQLETALPGSVPTIYTETTPGPNGLPTSCAVAASYLSALGFALKQTLSHFPGYYIEIFTI
jgi:hypothetical protein